MAHAPRDGDGSLEPFGKRQREEDPWRRMQAFRNRTSLLIPLGVCTLPAFLLLGVAPLLLSVLSSTPLPL